MSLTEVQGTQSFVAASALTSGSTATNSIEGIAAVTIQPGAEAYAILEGTTYRYIEDSLTPPSGTTVILPSSLDVSEPGRWVEVEGGATGAGGDPVAAQLSGDETEEVDNLLLLAFDINQSGFTIDGPEPSTFHVPSDGLYQFALTVDVTGSDEATARIEASIVRLAGEGPEVQIGETAYLTVPTDSFGPLTVSTVGMQEDASPDDFFAVRIIQNGVVSFSSTLDVAKVQATGPTGATGASGGETLAQTLVLGNVTGPTDIVQSNGTLFRNNNIGDILDFQSLGPAHMRTEVPPNPGDAAGDVLFTNGGVNAQIGPSTFQINTFIALLAGNDLDGSQNGGSLIGEAGDGVQGGQVQYNGGNGTVQGGLIDFNGGDGGDSGGPVSLDAGDGINVGSGGGSASLRAGSGSLAGGNLEVLAGNASESGSLGGSWTGQGGGGEAGGYASLRGGFGVLTGGALNLYGGDASDPAGAGGSVSINGGSGDVAGGVFLSGANGTTSGGNVSAIAGTATGSGGVATLQGGAAVGGVGVGGGVNVTGGLGDTDGGGVSVTGGQAVDGDAGDVDITGGLSGGASGAGGDVTLHVGQGALSNGRIRFEVAPGVFLTFPTDDGTPGQVLSTDGAGNLSWVTP